MNGYWKSNFINSENIGANIQIVKQKFRNSNEINPFRPSKKQLWLNYKNYVNYWSQLH